MDLHLTEKERKHLISLCELYLGIDLEEDKILKKVLERLKNVG